MAWTTRIIHVDKETGEVLDPKNIHKLNFEVKESQTIYHKIHETHTERIIIKLYGAKAQQQLQF